MKAAKAIVTRATSSEVDERADDEVGHMGFWNQPRLVGGVGTAIGPALTVFGFRPYMAWRGVGNDSGIYWSTLTGGSEWVPQQRVNHVGTGVGPALAVFDNQLFMAWKGVGPSTDWGIPIIPFVVGISSTSNDSGIYWSSLDRPGSANWRGQQKVQHVGTSVGPALAVYQGKLYMAWKGAGNDSNIYWSSYDGRDWAGQQQFAGATSTRPALAVFDNRLHMAWKGTGDDTRIFRSSFDGRNWLPQQLTPFKTGTGPALTAYRGRLHMAWTEAGFLVWSSSNNGQAWGAPEGTVEGARVGGQPALATTGPKLYIAWKGPEGQIYWTSSV